MGPQCQRLFSLIALLNLWSFPSVLHLPCLSDHFPGNWDMFCFLNEPSPFSSPYLCQNSLLSCPQPPMHPPYLQLQSWPGLINPALGSPPISDALLPQLHGQKSSFFCNLITCILIRCFCWSQAPEDEGLINPTNFIVSINTIHKGVS